MKRISLDTESAAVRDFIERLPLESDGVELELNGHTICTVIPTRSFSPADRESLIRDRWELIRRARSHSEGVPAKVIERTIQQAVEEVRRRNQQ